MKTLVALFRVVLEPEAETLAYKARLAAYLYRCVMPGKCGRALDPEGQNS